MAHGGASLPGGPGHPTFRHGAYSKAYGPLQEAVDAAMDDPDIFDTRRGVAGWHAAMEEASARLEENDTPEFRKRAQAMYDEVEALMRTDPASAGAKLRDLGSHLRRGISHDKALRDLLERMERHRIAVNDAVKIELQSSTAVSLTSLGAMLTAMVRILGERFGREGARDALDQLDRECFKGGVSRLLGTRAVEESE